MIIFFDSFQPRLQGVPSLKQKMPLKRVHGNGGSEKGRYNGAGDPK